MSPWRKRDPFTSDKAKESSRKWRKWEREAKRIERVAERLRKEGERRARKLELEKKKAERDARKLEREKKKLAPFVSWGGNAAGGAVNARKAVNIPPPNASEAEWCAYVARKLRGSLGIEQRLPDGTRCDILTVTHAWEVDFARKVYEGVSQAFHYGQVAGRRGGLILLINPTRDQRHVHKAKKVLESYPPEMRPVLLLCNILNGKLQSATSPNEDVQLLLPEVSRLLSGSIAGRGCLLIGMLILFGSLMHWAAIDSFEPGAGEIVSESGAPSPDESRQLPLAPNPAQNAEKEPDSFDQAKFQFPGTEPQFAPTRPKITAKPDIASEFRTWTDSSGDYSTEAKFVKFNAGLVWLQKSDQTVISISPIKLSERDRTYLQNTIGVQLEMPVLGHVNAVSQSRPGMCEVRFVVDVGAKKGDIVELQRDGVSVGMFRVVAVQQRDAVLESATLRPRIGDTAIFLEAFRDAHLPQ